MNGAESLVRTLLAGGVDVCFTNPGTSEMHFVAALDKVPGMRCVLGLFEGVVTGAADGYWRMSGKPASTLLHLGPGLANGLANLHNARKANSGVVNVVGEHATYHIAYDAPLTADIEGLARPISHWVKTSPSAKDIAADGAAAIEAARTAPGQIATLILPADTAWNEANEPIAAREPAPRPTVSGETVDAAAKALKAPGKKLILLGGDALRADALAMAGRIAAKTGCALMTEGANARLDRGAGRVQVDRIPYVVDQARAVLDGYETMVTVGARPPVAFFAYPDKPSLLAPDDCKPVKLAGLEDDIAGLQKRWPTPWVRSAKRRHRSPSHTGRRRPTARSHRRASPTCSARCCLKKPSSSTSRSPPAAASSPSPPAHRRTSGSTTVVVPSATPCRSRSAPPSPVRIARSWCWRATAAACTRRRDYGRWRARISM